MILISLVIASKFLEDYYFSNKDYAFVGGVDLKELNLIEIEFLLLIDYKLFVSNEVFFNYKDKFNKL